jgi:hypothetical protein
LNNPGCACNTPIYVKILKECVEQVRAYFPGKEITDPDKEVENLAKNNWRVINCHILELESELRRLPPGRKQIDVARFEDQVTCVINELDVLY